MNEPEKKIYPYQTPVDPPAEKPVCPPICATEPYSYQGFEPILSDEAVEAKSEDDAEERTAVFEDGAQTKIGVSSAPEVKPTREIKYRVSDAVEEMSRDKATTYARHIMKILKEEDHGSNVVDIDNFLYGYEQLTAANLIKYPNESLDELHANSHAGTYIRYAAPELLKYYNGVSEFETIEALMEDAFQRKTEEDNPTSADMEEIEKLIEDTEKLADEAEAAANEIHVEDEEESDDEEE